MFLGHYAVALAAKRAAPKTSLGTLFFAAQLADMLWPVLLLLGRERVRIVGGPNPFLIFAFDSYPISHSLVTLIAWALLVAVLYRVRTGYATGAVVLGACVLSHWVLDLVTHRPDLPIYPGGPTVGLGLWNSAAGTVLVEGLMFVAGVAIYLTTTRARAAGATVSGRYSPCSSSPTSLRSSRVRRPACTWSRSAGSSSGGCLWGGLRGSTDGAPARWGQWKRWGRPAATPADPARRAPAPSPRWCCSSAAPTGSRPPVASRRSGRA